MVYESCRFDQSTLDFLTMISWGCAIVETHFKFEKNLEGKLVVTNGDLWALLDFLTPPLFY